MSSPRYPGSEPYAYNPYGPAHPTAGQPAPVRKPGLMVLSMVLMALATLPFLLFGLLLLLGPFDADNLPPALVSSPRLQEAGATPELLISALRLAGGVILAAAVLYLLFGTLAFAGRNWARVITAVLTVGFSLLLVAALVASGGAVDTVAIAGVLLVLVVGAGVILFTPAANAWYVHRR